MVGGRWSFVSLQKHKTLFFCRRRTKKSIIIKGGGGGKVRRQLIMLWEYFKQIILLT